MSDETFDTVYLKANMEKIRAGDNSARSDLIRRAQRRLEKMAARMLRGFPRVKRWEETNDVLQRALVRLLRALEAVEPANTRAFFGLAAEQIRRELIDLARYYSGPESLGSNYSSGVLTSENSSNPGSPEAQDHQPDDLEQWRSFHEAVEQLPAVEREVFSLAYYHGWTQKQIADLFQQDERNIRRHWKAACDNLKQRMAGEWNTPD